MTAERPAVILLMRPAWPGYFSIEQLFESLEPHLAAAFDVRIVRVPAQGAGLAAIARNLIFTARLRADVIHVTGDVHYCALAVRRRRSVLTIHDLGSLGRLAGARRLVFALLWYALPLRWAGQVTVISAETARQLEDGFPRVCRRPEVIPNAVSDSFRMHRRDVPREGGRLRVLQVGTAPNKNLERVAAAAAGLPVHLRIIGALSARQRALLGSLDLEWTSAEQLSHDELVREYCGSDILVFASTSEGFGLPIAEAQANGLPVVTSRIAPMTEVAGDGALFVDPYREADIRSALELLLHSPGLARSLSERGRCNAERFEARAIASRYGGVYRHACGGKRPAAEPGERPGSGAS